LTALVFCLLNSRLEERHLSIALLFHRKCKSCVCYELPSEILDLDWTYLALAF